jgi:hypothetical protein
MAEVGADRECDAANGNSGKQLDAGNISYGSASLARLRYFES